MYGGRTMAKASAEDMIVGFFTWCTGRYRYFPNLSICQWRTTKE